MTRRRIPFGWWVLLTLNLFSAGFCAMMFALGGSWALLGTAVGNASVAGGLWMIRPWY